MRVVTEYNDKRVDIKLPISRHDSKPDTPITLAALLNEVLAAHGLQNELKVTCKKWDITKSQKGDQEFLSRIRMPK